MKISRR